RRLSGGAWSRTRAACAFWRLIFGSIQAVVQPGAGKLPIPANLCQVLSQNLSGCFVGIAAEETKLYDFGSIRINFRQLFKCVINGDQILVLAAGHVISLVDRNVDAFTLLSAMLTGVVHQDTPHLVRCDC